MKAITLVKYGKPEEAFEIREYPDPRPGEGEVLIDVEVFGLNFAEVMARLGMYRDCPPLPAVLGYEVVGTIADTGSGVGNLRKGQRVVAFTRFGGYATRVVTPAIAAVPLPGNIDPAAATALATQYSTAWYCAEEMVNLHPGDRVLIHAAAGGVGTALVQIASRHDCEIFGTAGSDSKLDYIRQQGVTHAINYRKTDFAGQVKRSGNGKLDVIFDCIGGDYIRKGLQLLDAGGRLVSYGAASMADTYGKPWKRLKVALQFGIYHPVTFIMHSRALIGVNMLRIADHKPAILQRCLTRVVELAASGELRPVVGKVFRASQIAEAHRYMQSRQSMGKIAVMWD